jgi:hypothetical protein
LSSRASKELAHERDRPPPAAPAASPAATPVSTAPAATLPAPSTLAPAAFTELVEFAEIAARSNLVPKDYRGRAEDILLAVQLGSEIGLRPMQSLQNIAVINGRPAIWATPCPPSATLFQSIKT